MILRADALGFTYPHQPPGGMPAISNLSAVFMPGEVTVLLGPNGSGKSTLLRLLAGLLAPATGLATINGLDITRLSPGQRARSLAYIPQRDDDAGDFTVLEAVAMGRFAAGREQSSRGVASRACERAGLAELGDRRVGTLSAGQRQRVLLARALCQVHGIPGAALLADEPAAALDPAYASVSSRRLREHAQTGAAVVVAMHDLNAAARLAHRVLIIGPGGVCLAHGPTETTMTPETLARAFGTRFLCYPTPAGPTFIPDPDAGVPADPASPYASAT